MTKTAGEHQVDSGVKKGQTDLPDRSGRLTGHTRQAMKGEATERTPRKNRQGRPPKPGVS
jgi:hypothetical protein